MASALSRHLCTKYAGFRVPCQPQCAELEDPDSQGLDRTHVVPVSQTTKTAWSLVGVAHVGVLPRGA